MRNVNWDSIHEKQPGDYNNPDPGGYIAVITRVEDHEDKEYLEIQWDFISGVHKGYNQDTFSRAGFWPTVLRRSYKESALSFFKAFKTAVERSNNGYFFDCANVYGLVGKRMGLVLGDEEYRKSSGEIKTRLYVYQVRSVSEIQNGNFEVPKLKRLSNNSAHGAQQRPYTPYQAGASYGAAQFVPIEEDGDLPF